MSKALLLWFTLWLCWLNPSLIIIQYYYSVLFLSPNTSIFTLITLIKFLKGSASSGSTKWNQLLARSHLRMSWWKQCALYICMSVSSCHLKMNKLVETSLSLPSLLPILFCSTSLPQASTRWVWSTISSHSPLSFKQRCWLTSATALLK